MCCLLGESLSPSLHGSPALPTRDRARSAIASPSEVRHVPARNTLRSQQYIQGVGKVGLGGWLGE